ncbi:phosphate transporter PHO1 [Eucalyptus grandis]|uniref:phosphate transporter PHO1 n=1 Tax=Eucalyptus grandis TaxID=71139 RepID=UPI00192EE76A|nr:phosphate transporter PHO1 [Eucalyptus grandis]
MVKFSKELEAQLIPEWKDAFVNYWQLKKHVKKIKLSRKPKQPQEVDRDFGLSIFDPIRSVAKKVAGKFQKSANSTDIIQKKNARDVEDGQGGEEEEEEHEVYENELVQLFSEEDEVNLFFEKLDEELDKVNQFYKSTEDEFLERGDALEKQLQMLLDLKQILADRHRKNSSSFRGTGGGGASPLSSWPSSARTSNFSEAPTELLETTTDASETDDVIAALERNGVTFVGAAARSKLKSNGKPKTTMRIDIPATTPTRMITAVTATLLEDLVNNPRKDGPAYFVYKKRIQYAEKMIRGAFVELYKGLGLLKTYSSLNMMAFTKILKKFDKVAKRQASTSYLKGVKKSHFISSDKVVRLMDEVESIFTKHFANNDSKKAMKFLKPQHNKESHTITFFVGLFTGSFVTLFTIYAILAHIAGIFNSNLDMGYMETVYPVFSIFTLLSLHLFMYGCNLYMWKGTRINHNFIFEFSSSTALKYRDAFLLCTTFMTAVVGAMIVHLLLRANNFSRSKVDAIPGALLLISFAVLVCPIDMFYRSTRFCFIRIMRNIFFSPLYQVLLVDSFMADQLTSQIPLLRHMETTACYLLARSFQTHQYDTCDSGRAYRELSYVISFLPYYWRAMQCARRWFNDSDKTNLANMGKYVSAMVAAGARIAYARQPHNHLWLCTVLVTSVVATMYQLYWDFVRDWGLLEPKSKNPWLRDQLVLKRKSIYYMSIALNVVLRVAWLETVIRFRAGKAEKKMLDFFMASLEVIRRGHWNFYRLENEQLTNAGKFRAVKEVPLPFRETDSD